MSRPTLVCRPAVESGVRGVRVFQRPSTAGEGRRWAGALWAVPMVAEVFWPQAATAGCSVQCVGQ